MDIFLSWSGDRSKIIAEKFKSFLVKVVQKANPFISSQDIDLGLIWQKFLLQEVVERRFGLIFITPENTLSHWLHYEAGGLIKDLNQDKVVPILFGVSKKNISTPFSQFQMIEYNEDSVFRLITQINSQTVNPLSGDDLKELFSAFFPKFNEEILSILSSESNKVENRTTEDMLFEVLELLRDQKNIISKSLREELLDIPLGASWLTGIATKKKSFFTDDTDLNSLNTMVGFTNAHIQRLKESGFSESAIAEFIENIPVGRVKAIMRSIHGPSLFGSDSGSGI